MKYISRVSVCTLQSRHQAQLPATFKHNIIINGPTTTTTDHNQPTKEHHVEWNALISHLMYNCTKCKTQMKEMVHGIQIKYTHTHGRRRQVRTHYNYYVVSISCRSKTHRGTPKCGRLIPRRFKSMSRSGSE